MKQPKHLTEPPMFATESAKRRKKPFNTHRTLGHARSSLKNNVNPGILNPTSDWRCTYYTNVNRLIEQETFDVYQFIDGEWVHLPEESFDPTVGREYKVDEYKPLSRDIKGFDRVWVRAL